MNRKLVTLAAIGGFLLGGASAALAEEVTFDMHAISEQGVGEKAGTITAYDSDNGLVVRAQLSADVVRPGPHGFHVHENASCEAAEKDGKMGAGLAAGGHYDPNQTGKHMGPTGRGHLGDLPVLFVEPDEMGAPMFKRVVVAPRLKVSDVKGRAVVVHESGDNYADEPKPLGGGGGRIACGVVPQ